MNVDGVVNLCGSGGDTSPLHVVNELVSPFCTDKWWGPKNLVFKYLHTPLTLAPLDAHTLAPLTPSHLLGTRTGGWVEGHKSRRAQGWEGVRARGCNGRRAQGQEGARVGGLDGARVGGHKMRRAREWEDRRARGCKGRRATRVQGQEGLEGRRARGWDDLRVQRWEG